jgi:hypothetical protein
MLTKRTDKSRILWFESWVMILFGLFHLHRVWGLINRSDYARFWMGLMNSRGAVYYLITATLFIPCLAGIIVFFSSIKQNYWWRWIYIFGGGYVILDLLSQLFKVEFVIAMLKSMFDTENPYWNVLWGFFVILGGFVFTLGIILECSRRYATGPAA